MPTVTLREITELNRAAVEALSVTDEQRFYVADVATSLREAVEYPEAKAWYRAVYADDEPVGFVMISDGITSHDPTLIGPYYLWRLLVDHRFQGLGHGTTAIDLVVAHVRTRPDARELLVSHVVGPSSPRRLLRALRLRGHRRGPRGRAGPRARPRPLRRPRDDARRRLTPGGASRGHGCSGPPGAVVCKASGSSNAPGGTVTVLLAYVSTPEGDAALATAVQEARLRSTDAVVVNITRPQADVDSPFSAEQTLDAVAERFAAAGVNAIVRQVPTTPEVAEAILDIAAETGADLLVIGLRRRSTVGKFVLGSTSQRILLGADCPVVAVKADLD